VIETIIRSEIGFDGLLLSDDMSMEALKGDFGSRARAIFDAGCDIALHCNGRLEEARAVAAASPILAGASLQRAKRAISGLKFPPESFDPVDAASKLDAALALQG
jgi:beta-N-acetylhexosaminidase